MWVLRISQIFAIFNGVLLSGGGIRLREVCRKRNALVGRALGLQLSLEQRECRKLVSSLVERTGLMEWLKVAIMGATFRVRRAGMKISIMSHGGGPMEYL